MNDATARRLLAGIDGPRPLPRALGTALVAALTDGEPVLGGVDAPRALPPDLRHRLEASLVVAAARPVPRQVRRDIVAATRRRAPLAGVATAAAVLLLLGLFAAVRPADDERIDAAHVEDLSPRATASGTPTTAGSQANGGTTPAVASGATTDIPFAGPTSGAGSAGSAGSTSSAPAPGAAADAAAGAGGQQTAIAVAVVGGGTDVAAGFDAYLRTLNGAGGVNGRAVVARDSQTPGAVATVNLGHAPLSHAVDGVVFETAFVDEPRLRDLVISLASPLERQARLAVARAFPADAPGARATVYAGAAEPWTTVVPAALEAALRDRGVTPTRVPFASGAPTFVPADAAFLSLDPFEASAWVQAAPSRHERGAWGIVSAWDDRLAPRAADLGLTVLSPYAPAGGDEQAALLEALGPDARLSAAVVHGWVTAKAIALLLAGNDGDVVTAGDLDRLGGWDPGWAPPFEVRPGTRARTPDAVTMRADGDRFAPAGGFERDPS